MIIFKYRDLIISCGSRDDSKKKKPITNLVRSRYNKHFSPAIKLIACFFFLCFSNAHGQSLPGKQIESVYLKNASASESSLELAGGFRAYNKNVDVFYSIENDNNNVFFLIKATDPLIIRKIINGGVSLQFAPSGEKKKLAIEFPIYEGDAPSISSRKIEQRYTDSLKQGALVDSLNSILRISQKLIEVGGFSDVSGSIISVYNDIGIDVACSFNNNLNLICKFTIPIKYIPFDKNNTFIYTIRLDGYHPLITKERPIPPPPPPVVPKDRVLYSPTYFSATYTLAAQ